jgi:hypothetical protein
MNAPTTAMRPTRQRLYRAWYYPVHGLSGFTVPVYFLDADLPDNAAWDRTLTGTLYGGNAHYRIVALLSDTWTDAAALLCVTTAQDGRVSDARTRCHIDVEGRTRDTLP